MKNIVSIISLIVLTAISCNCMAQKTDKQLYRVEYGNGFCCIVDADGNRIPDTTKPTYTIIRPLTDQIKATYPLYVSNTNISFSSKSNSLMIGNDNNIETRLDMGGLALEESSMLIGASVLNELVGGLCTYATYFVTMANAKYPTDATATIAVGTMFTITSGVLFTLGIIKMHESGLSFSGNGISYRF